MIAIIDYGMGNLRSVQKALQFVGQDAVITSYLDEINKEQSLKLKQGDLLSIDKDIHTFENQTDEVVEFIVFLYLPSYKNQSEMIKNDKEIIER